MLNLSPLFFTTRALGDPLFQPFRAHQAGAPIFYHGPNKNVPEAAC